jgi:hypothetical protein
MILQQARPWLQLGGAVSGLLFIMEIAAFVLLAYWAYRNSDIGLGDRGRGLFAFRDGTSDSDENASSVPRWKQHVKGAQAAKAPEPRWKLASPPRIGSKR